MPPHAMDDRPGLLLAGATGFLGGEVLARLLERGARPVYALVRAGSDEEASQRLRRVIGSLLGSAEPWSRGAVAIAADITRPGLGLDSARRAWLAERVGRVVHCAASVSFTLGLDESRAINVEGTRRVLDLGALCARRGGLDCFTHVSTAYVAGTHAGRFGEDELDVGQGFRSARCRAWSRRPSTGAPSTRCWCGAEARRVGRLSRAARPSSHTSRCACATTTRSRARGSPGSGSRRRRSAPTSSA